MVNSNEQNGLSKGGWIIATQQGASIIMVAQSKQRCLWSIIVNIFENFKGEIRLYL